MLAVLYLILYGGIYAIFIFGQICDVVRNAAPTPLAIMVDATLGTVLLSTNFRFMYRVGRINWSISQETLDA